MLSLSPVCHRYGSSTELHFPGFAIGQGESLLIRGNSGSGKTTLLHIAAGLLRPTKGTVCYNGKDIYQQKPSHCDQQRGRQFGIIFQKAYLVKNLTVLQNLLAAMYFAGMKPDKQKALLKLEQLNLLPEKDKFPYMLSQGQAQRAAIARAVANQPSVLFADEPTSSLDDENTIAVARLMQNLASEMRASLVVSSHDSRLMPYFQNVYTLKNCSR